MSDIINIDKFQLDFINDIKNKIKQSQYEALKSVNIELINLYWEIGKSISERQHESWGKSIVSTLSNELQKEFPGMSGFSVSNLWSMNKFYNEYHDDQKLQPLVGEISWSKHIVIMNKCKDNEKRLFYVLATKKFGWTKNVLTNQIDNQAYEKYLANQTNFERTLPLELQNQAALAVKDEYTFDFLDLADDHTESQLESKLVSHIQEFLAELGYQFAFIGRQFKLTVDDNEYFVDLMLFHRQLRCLVAIELKIGEFQPEYKGKMEFYLNVINEKVKLPDENDAIGIIICKEKKRTIVEYSLKSGTMPIGVATYSTSPNLPKNLHELLPSNQEISEQIEKLFLDE